MTHKFKLGQRVKFRGKKVTIISVCDTRFHVFPYLVEDDDLGDRTGADERDLESITLIKLNAHQDIHDGRFMFIEGNAPSENWERREHLDFEKDL